MINYGSAGFIIIGVLVGIWAVRLILHNVCAFSTRTANDVFPFLFKIDRDALCGTFHPEVEDNFRATLSPAEFKKKQWKRIHLAIHYCDQIANNARIFLEWIQYEQKQGWLQTSPVALQRTVQELRTACIQSRLSVFLIRTRLRLWLLRMTLFPFVAPPSFTGLLRVGSGEMVAFYEKVTTLAISFSQVYGPEYHEKFLQAL